MNRLIKLEYGFLCVLSLYAFSLMGFRWWLYPLFFLVPDVSMAGYAMNTRVGAIIYNVVHTFVLAVLLLIGGHVFASDWLVLSGIILFGHIAFDRMCGFGLKYADAFSHTHITND